MTTETPLAGAVADDAAAEPSLFATMSTMRAMRRLRPDPVPDELLDQLVQAAVWGPSGGNMQRYEYVVVTDRAVMAELAPLWKRCVDAYLATPGSTPPRAWTRPRTDAWSPRSSTSATTSPTPRR